MAKPEENYLSIGQVLRPQGLQGQVKIRPDTDDAGRFSSLRHAYSLNARGEATELPLHDISVRGGFVYLRIDGDASVEDAQKRRDLHLYVPRSEAVPLNEFENFITDLIGCTLSDSNGKVIGTVTDVLQPGANDVYQVKTPEGRMLLVPALRHVITQVDVNAKTMTADATKLWEVSIFED